MKAIAKLTGFLYLIVAILGVFGFFYIQAQLFVSGNMAATAEKMLAGESLFRLSVLIHLISNIIFLTVIILLYELLKKIHILVSRLMLWFVCVAIPLFFITEALQFTAFYVFKRDLLASFSSVQAYEIAATLLRISNVAGELLMFHWGLWLIPLGWLVFKSGFIPKIFGVLLWINGAGYMIASLTYFLWPAQLPLVTTIVMPTYFSGELPLIVWLLIKGIKEPRNMPE
ncbi:MAG: DUF4386 domain-containing protein [Chitinophagaceae bacterium]|nr:DUF4386 domain-containing protein [Chitinophagaceae bacterium]